MRIIKFMIPFAVTRISTLLTMACLLISMLSFVEASNGKEMLTGRATIFPYLSPSEWGQEHMSYALQMIGSGGYFRRYEDSLTPKHIRKALAIFKSSKKATSQKKNTSKKLAVRYLVTNVIDKGRDPPSCREKSNTKTKRAGAANTLLRYILKKPEDPPAHLDSSLLYELLKYQKESRRRRHREEEEELLRRQCPSCRGGVCKREIDGSPNPHTRKKACDASGGCRWIKGVFSQRELRRSIPLTLHRDIAGLVLSFLELTCGACGGTGQRKLR